MLRLLRSGEAFGYLGYVDGRAAAWVNASKLRSCALHRRGEGADPPDDDVLAVSCFVVAPPYRRHGLAARLLDRVLADAEERGLSWIEGYPVVDAGDAETTNFRGPRSLYDARGFDPVEDRGRETVLRRPVRADRLPGHG
jgi:GNAT superfamily N-acetyltransferase